MNSDFKIIDKNGTKIGVGKSPITGGTLVVIEDNVTKNWIDLDKFQVEELKKCLTEETN